MISVSDILKAIETGADIPTLAPVIRRLVALKNEREEDAKLFIDLAKTDPALCVRMLRAAMHPANTTIQSIMSIRQLTVWDFNTPVILP